MDSEVCYINIEILKVFLLDFLFVLWLIRLYDCFIIELFGVWNRVFLGVKLYSVLFLLLYFNYDYNLEFWVIVVCVS